MDRADLSVLADPVVRATGPAARVADTTDLSVLVGRADLVDRAAGLTGPVGSVGSVDLADPVGSGDPVEPVAPRGPSGLAEGSRGGLGRI